MASPRILAVDDENIVEGDPGRRSNHLGHGVVGLALSREEAVRKAAAATLDRVLTRLGQQGEMEGIETVAELRQYFGARSNYIAILADREWFQGAKMSGPVGYILKPFGAGVAYTIVQMVFHRYKLERELQRLEERERGLTTALKCIGDAVLTTDAHSCTTFMNPVAVALTGWSQKDALGKNLTEVFNIGNEQASGVTDSPVNKALRDGAVSLATDRVLVDKDGTQTLVDYSATPIKDMMGNITGAVVVFRGVTGRAKPTLDMLDEGKRPA